ncbi:hypothetical protein HD553DRAFT_354885 [Filobasidium floriforme]|uniref:uncharacterized protein n=1 Tax=Filobasidium floriforme TaxID=5210 RepID=UPI001E8DF387|nr:uncharacterized protein HD553DRAFT_354885 [Filobasidium floriforme]KAH8090962.1 hypothetical protein HD553DRAFT_354885 [Filobasidium floriforme]
MSGYSRQPIEEARSRYLSSGQSSWRSSCLPDPSLSSPSLPRHANVVMTTSDHTGYGDRQQIDYPYESAPTDVGHPYYLQPSPYHQRTLSDESVATKAVSPGYQYFPKSAADQDSRYEWSSPVPPGLLEYPDSNCATTVYPYQTSAETMQNEHCTEASAAPDNSSETNIYRVRRKDGQDFKYGELKVKVPHVDVNTWKEIAAVTGRARGTISKGGRQDDTWKIQIIAKRQKSRKQRKTDKELDPDHRANISAGSTNKKWYLVHRVRWHEFKYDNGSVKSVRLQVWHDANCDSPTAVQRSSSSSPGNPSPFDVLEYDGM